MHRFSKVSSSAFVLTLASLAALPGCSLKKKLDAMENATVAVPDKLDGMKRTTDSMQETTCTMKKLLSQGDSKKSRDTDFQSLEEAKEMSAKLVEASEYMQGFEYQIWTTDCENMLPRELVIEQFARELLAKIQAYAVDHDQVHPADLSSQIFGKKKNRANTLFALAATLHYKNALQDNLLRGTSHKSLRPFDILVEGLMIDSKRNRGELELAQVPAYAEVIGKYSKDAIYLLRLRQNFLLAYAAAVADSNEDGDLPGTWGKLKRITSSAMFGKKWTPSLKIRTATEIDERITIAIQYALETHEALRALGVDPMLDRTFRKIWENADLGSFKAETLLLSSNPADRVFGRSVLNLKAARDRLVTLSRQPTTVSVRVD